MDATITMVEARQLLAALTPLAKGCVFTKDEFLEIIKICNKALMRESLRELRETV